MIKIENLGKTYEGGFKALRAVDLNIERGEIFALLGPNGAGKTTLINIVCGIVRATEGKVLVDGADIEYVGCGVELLAQCDKQGLVFDSIITATGSAGTQAGLAVGLRASDSDMPILGIGVNAPQQVQEERVYNLALETASLVDADGCVKRDDIIADCNYIGSGYGQTTESMNDAVLLLARLEGLLFDPVYSGKALAGMIDYIHRGEFERGQRIVFLHTGGSAGLFAYSDVLKV